jgi:hypothetical protein
MSSFQRSTTSTQQFQSPASIAQSILTLHAHEPPDDALGDYVTSRLQRGDEGAAANLEDLCELLQEHCHMSEAEAETALQEVSKAIRQQQQQQQQSLMISHPVNRTIRETVAPSEQENNNFQQETEDPFPPLGAAVTSKKKKRGTATTANVQTIDLQKNVISQYDLDTCMDVLRQYHPLVSTSALYAAATLASAEVSLAHYILQAATTSQQQQVPTCRYYLSEAGCYLKDCAYRHAPTTCLFWIQGTCVKQDATCLFQHAFDESLIDAYRAAVRQQQQDEMYQQEPLTIYNTGSAYDEQHQHRYDPSGYHNNEPLEQYSHSFVNVAAQGTPTFRDTYVKPAARTVPTTVKLPLDLWTAHETRDASVFAITDPMERFYAVAAQQQRNDDSIIDLHFQSTVTFSVVLAQVLPARLCQSRTVWIVTGTGHHVHRRTHQQGGGALERAVVQWLNDEGYAWSQGRDRNGQGGAILVYAPDAS